jgi:cycloeucalenol cycloisomerase
MGNTMGKAKGHKIESVAIPIEVVSASRPSLVLDLIPLIAIQMAGILCSICGIIYAMTYMPTQRATGNWLPTKNNLAKLEFEVFALKYTAIWIGIFTIVIVFQMYTWFTELEYMVLCVGLDLPFLLQPIFFPLPAEKALPLFLRYSFKANVWLAIFAFIGSYWYTQYFYSVLGAKYTMPSHRLNDVPIALYFAAHFYFVTYHTLSNMILRKIESRYAAGPARSMLFWTTVLGFSYFTAFMETLSISSFPDYSFRDRDMAYTLGSAFYGIYFIVSFPVFYRIDENVSSRRPLYTAYQTVMDACGSSMIVLCLLDFSRLALGIPLNIGDVGYYVYHKKP